MYGLNDFIILCPSVDYKVDIGREHNILYYTVWYTWYRYVDLRGILRR